MSGDDTVVGAVAQLVPRGVSTAPLRRLQRTARSRSCCLSVRRVSRVGCAVDGTARSDAVPERHTVWCCVRSLWEVHDNGRALPDVHACESGVCPLVRSCLLPCRGALPAAPSQDILKTKKKCLDTAQAAIASKRSAVIDATNRDAKVRGTATTCIV